MRLSEHPTFGCFFLEEAFGYVLISEGSNAHRIMRDVSIMKLKPHQDDGRDMLQIGCMAFTVQSFKQFIHFCDSLDKRDSHHKSHSIVMW